MALRMHATRWPGGSRDDEPAGERIDPSLLSSLGHHLIASDRPALAATVEQLPIVERCRCGDPDCESFYTDATRQSRCFRRRCGERIELAPGLSVDVLDGQVVAGEVLHDHIS